MSAAAVRGALETGARHTITAHGATGAPASTAPGGASSDLDRIGYNLHHPNARPTGVGHPGCPEPAARAKVAELVDALGLGPSGETRESSSLSFRTSST
jgi:hypothetical protein